jgi:hypothetical protein
MTITSNKQFSFRAGLATLALAFCLLGGGPTAKGQVECIGNCLRQLDECNTRTGGSTQCEDEYVACLEGCLSE